MTAVVSTTAAQGEAAFSPEAQQYLTFSLAGEMFAIGTLGIKEIIEYGHVTTVPMAPAYIRGVINLRGAVVPVVDLRVRFNQPATAVTRRSCIVITEVAAEDGTQVLGIVVDAVSEVLELDPSNIEPPPAFGAKIRSDFIAGVGKVAGQFVVLLDVDKVLSIAELSGVSSLVSDAL
jgi:purine-binding chemotaxis protein CheW